MVDLAWPNDLGAGTAVWQLFRMGADNWDEDRDPQLKAAHETIVEFTPDVTQVVRYEGEMGKASIEPMVSRGIINREGQLCTMNEDGTAGPVGVILPATDSETITPRNWTYRATITKNRVRVREFSFPVPADTEVDLADYIEIEASGGTHIITEIETAERAEAAASDAERYRNETRTDRQAAQTARTGAETAETNAKTHATDAASSASSAADILTATEALGVTVDTSVGERIFVGDTMIYGDTGIIDISHLLQADWEIARTYHHLDISRTGNLVVMQGYISRATAGIPRDSVSHILTPPQGFLPYSYPLRGAAKFISGNSPVGALVSNGNETRIESQSLGDGNWKVGDLVQLYASWRTKDAWPTSLDF